MKVRPCTLITATTSPFSLRPSPFLLRTSPPPHGAPLPRRAGRIIERPHEPPFALQQGGHFLLVPEMVPAGDHVHAGGEDLLGRLRRYARAGARILPCG